MLREADRCVVIQGTTAGEALLDHGGGAPAFYPGAFVLEAMAQAALPLGTVEAAATRGNSPAPRAGGGAPPVLVAISEARVTRAVRVGDRLRITSEVQERFAGMIRVRSRAEIDGVSVAEGEFTFAIDLRAPSIEVDGRGEGR
jgi:3-hydroxymyristoyl/3-hydroxydecanoyl-(acyl carrier protein) dehydratase